MASLMTADQGNSDRIAIEVEECKLMGIDVLAPNINESFEEFTVIETDNKENIRFGLNAIKNVGYSVAKEISKERQANGHYKNLVDFLERVTGKDLNKKSIEALAKVGALDDLGERNQIIENIDIILGFSKSVQKMKSSNQGSLFGGMEMETSSLTLSEIKPASKKQKLHWEKELLGLYVSDHPISDYREYFAHMSTSINSLVKNTIGRHINIGGVITKVKKIVTKRKQNMAFVTIEDLSGSLEILVFPHALENTGSVWKEENIILASGKISDKDGSFKLLVDDAKVVNDQEVEDFKRILATQKKNGNSAVLHKEQKNHTSLTINIANDSNSKSIIEKLSNIMNSANPGDIKVYLDLAGTKMQTSYSIEKNEDIMTKIKDVIPEDNIKLA
jgi:DNA polymerase-3 subunit alpha